MIAKSSKKNFSSISKKILIIIISLLIIINLILFVFIKSESFKSSDINITKNIQDALINKNSNSIPFFLKMVHFLNNIHYPYLIIIIIFNFYTTYDCFILINVLSIDYIVIFLFKLLYQKPPYNSDEIKIFYCGYGWGFPSEESILMVSLYLSLWRIVSKLSINYNRSQKIIKNFLLFLLILLIIIYCFGILLIGYYSLSHIVFSLLTGLIIYFIMFETNIFNLLNGKEFIYFMKNKFINYIIIHLITFVILSLFYIIQRLNNDDKYKFCKTINNKIIFFKSGRNNSYIDGSYSFVILFLGNIFAILSIKMDILLIYQGNESNYLQFNFPQEWDDIIDNRSRGSRTSFGESINITKETLWNKTPIFISFLRLIIVILFYGICFIPYFLVELTSSNINIIFFIKFLLPTILLFPGIFFYFKPLLKIMKLTNFTLESILDDR